MDDLEITRLCARAAGYQPIDRDGYVQVGIRNEAYDPLHNRAQALELVERLYIQLSTQYLQATTDPPDSGKWWKASKVLHGDKFAVGDSPSILRAICLCAARVQQSKESQK